MDKNAPRLSESKPDRELGCHLTIFHPTLSSLIHLQPLNLHLADSADT